MYIFEASSPVPQFSSCFLLPLPLPLSRWDVTIPSSFLLCRPHTLGCGVSTSAPVQQMMCVTGRLPAEDPQESVEEGLFLLSHLSTPLPRKVGVIQSIPYPATNFLFSRNTWFLGNAYNICNLLRAYYGSASEHVLSLSLQHLGSVILTYENSGKRALAQEDIDSKQQRWNSHSSCLDLRFCSFCYTMLLQTMWISQTHRFSTPPHLVYKFRLHPTSCSSIVAKSGHQSHLSSVVCTSARPCLCGCLSF